MGAVLGAQGQRAFQITVTGEEGHAGTLPMNLRKDAFLGAARMADALNAVAFNYEPWPVITVGHVRVRPNSRNTIPGQTVFTIDSRHPHADILAAVKVEMIAVCKGIAADMGLELDVLETNYSAVATFDGDLVQSVREAAARLGLPCRDSLAVVEDGGARLHLQNLRRADVIQTLQPLSEIGAAVRRVAGAGAAPAQRVAIEVFQRVARQQELARERRERERAL